MCKLDTESAKFIDILLYIDMDLANRTGTQGCPYCKGRLHLARYRRKPRGGGRKLTEACRWRWSFCCDRKSCRRRATPPSVRFLGRRVYLGAVVALASCLEQGLSAARVAQLGLHLQVPRRTLKRWLGWWLEQFVDSAFWQHARALLMPPVDVQRLPGSLFERFAHAANIAQQLVGLLKFVSPLSTLSSTLAGSR